MPLDPLYVGAVQALAAVIAIGFLKPTVENRDTPGSHGFALFLCGIALWASSLAVGNFTGNLSLSIAAYKLVLLGTELAGIGWFLTAFGVVRGRSPSRRVLLVVGVFILGFQTLFWTNSLHHLMLAGYTRDGIVVLPQYNVGFWLHAAGGYLAVLLGIGLLGREALHSTGLRRRQMVLLILAALPIIAGNLVTVFDLLVAPFDVSPVGYLVSALVLVLVLYNGRFLDIATVARRTAVAELADAMVTLDAQDRVIDANVAARELFGVGDDYVGMPASEFFAPVPREVRLQFADVTDIEEETTVTLDGEQRHFSVSVSPIGADGDRGRVFVFRDITPQKRRERELQRQNERLDQFAGVVSHDLRNPLNVANGHLSLLQDTLDNDHLDAIEHSHERMETLIDDALTLAREGEAVTETEAVDLTALANSCWQTVATAEATLTVDTDAVIRADPSRLQRLLENLFRNAVEHGGDSVTITVADCSGGFYVADDGPGLPEDNREEVFETGVSTSESGTGFGLSIVNEIVEAHGWTIRAFESQTGGARFEVTGVESVE